MTKSECRTVDSKAVSRMDSGANLGLPPFNSNFELRTSFELRFSNFEFQPSPIDLAHHDVERADDRRHVGDQAAAAQFVRRPTDCRSELLRARTRQGIEPPSLTM